MKSAVILFALFLAGSVLAELNPIAAYVAGAAFVIVPAIAIFRPFPKYLRSRVFSGFLIVFVGFSTILFANMHTFNAERRAKLRESDPTAYLAEIQSVDKAKWLSEMKELDPKRHALESAKIVAEKAKLDAEKAAEKVRQEAAKAKEEARSKAEINEVRYQSLAREMVTAALKDPASAQFRNQRGLCGEVNSKNSFGGYAGFQRFIAAGNDMVLLEADSRVDRNVFRKLWEKSCK